MNWTPEGRKRFRRNRRKKLIEHKGGRCERCGFCYPVEVFDFHHRDPNKKEFNLTVVGMGARSWERIVAEADKCHLLCANCHRIVHVNKEKGYIDDN